tara:strand:+ start:32 stop:430 length:399 start_codon:yes stop_codon:yes gene_type:complete
MSAGRYSFVIEQGATTNFEIQYKDSNNVPVDLTNYTGKLQIKSTYAQDSGELFLTLSSSLNVDGTGLNFSGSNGSTPPTSGSIGIYIASCTSSALTFNEAVYDLELYSGSSDCPFTVRLLEGKIQLSKQVTT